MTMNVYLRMDLSAEGSHQAITNIVHHELPHSSMELNVYWIKSSQALQGLKLLSKCYTSDTQGW